MVFAQCREQKVSELIFLITFYYLFFLVWRRFQEDLTDMGTMLDNKMCAQDMFCTIVSGGAWGFLIMELQKVIRLCSKWKKRDGTVYNWVIHNDTLQTFTAKLLTSYWILRLLISKIASFGCKMLVEKNIAIFNAKRAVVYTVKRSKLIVV